MRKNHKILALLAVAMLLIVSVPSALSYFSTYTSAKGSRKLNIGNETEIYEKVEGNTKKIQITADKDSGDIYVRVKVFMPELSFLDTTQKPSGENWSLVNGYYEYGEILKAGDSTTILNIPVVVKDSEQAKAEVKEGDQFHVIVIYETVAVKYDDKGNALPADWKSNEVSVTVQEETQTTDPTTETGGETTEGGIEG